MNTLCFLGTGGSIPQKKRNNTSLALDTGGPLLLIDCPGDAFNKMKLAGLDPRKIESIFITHIHPDHVYGLPALIHSLMLEEMSVSIYGSKEAVLFCERLLGLFGLLDKKIKCRVQFKGLDTGVSFQILPHVRALCLSIPHSSSSSGIYFHFEENDMDLFYSGDTPVHLPLFKEIGSPDILIHDCSAPSRFFKEYPSLSKMHTHSLDLGKIAKQIGVKCLIPVHFFGELDYSMDEIQKEIKENYKNRLIIPKDLDRLTLSSSLWGRKKEDLNGNG